MDSKEQYINAFRELGRKYDFPVITLGGKEILTARNTDGESVKWIYYNPKTDTVSYIGNTDVCNIWFCNTRKDFTPEKTIQFVDDLNNTFELQGEGRIQIKELIDPEDWQGIADIHDAYEDARYNVKS